MGNATPYSGQDATSKQITDIMSTINRVELVLKQSGSALSLLREFANIGTGSADINTNAAPGLSLDSSNNIYLTDSGLNNRVQKFSLVGVHVTSFGQVGPGQGKFGPGVLGPRGIAVDGSNNIWTSDTQIGGLNLNHVQKFNSSHVFQFDFGSIGPSSADGGFSRPQDIVFLSSGHLLVVDNLNHRIQEFDSDGNFVSKFGTNGNGDGQFNAPHGIAKDSDGNIYVADRGNARIQKFDSSFSFLGKFGSPGSDNGQFSGLKNVAIDSNGNIYTTDDAENGRMQMFDSNFIYVTKVVFGDVSGGNVGGIVITSADVIVVFAGNSTNCIKEYTVVVDIIVGNPLLDAFGLTNWQKYGNMGTSESLDREVFSTSGPVSGVHPEVADNALVAQISKDKLQTGEICGSFNIRIVRDMRTAMEALAASGLITNIATGNTLTWDFSTNDDLYKSATVGKLAAMGRTTGTHSWTRSLPSMSGTRILDVDITEMKLCADFLEACVNA